MRTCHPWAAVVGAAIVCAALAACSSSAPVAPDANPKAPLNKDCHLAPLGDGGRQMSCLLLGELPDTQVDPAHPGSSACSATSFSVFKQSVRVPVWLSYGQKGADGPLQVRIGGVLGPGGHRGKLGKSAGNDCDATVGPVVGLDTRFSGRYVALVDKSQRPACVSQSSLTLSGFNQTMSAPVQDGVAGAVGEMTSDALQKRLDLEVATQANRYLQPSGKPLSDAALNRHGRCPEGFRTFSGQ